MARSGRAAQLQPGPDAELIALSSQRATFIRGFSLVALD